VVLIDGRYLAELMIDFDVGVNTVTVYQLKRVDSDYFEENWLAAPGIERTAKITQAGRDLGRLLDKSENDS